MIVKLLDLVSEEIIVHRGVKSLHLKTDSQKRTFYVLRFRTKEDSYPVKHYWIYEVRNLNFPFLEDFKSRAPRLIARLD